MSEFLSHSYFQLIKQGLKEDCVQWDWTAISTLKPKKQVKAKIVCKYDGIFCGETLVHAFNKYSKKSGFTFNANALLKDGKRVKKGDIAISITGEAITVLGLERTVLNLISYQSGMANMTYQMVSLIDSKWSKISNKKNCKKPRLTATRKILPGYRDLTIEAVRAGGGYCHRLNLGSGLLIKENHIEACGGVSQALSQAKQNAPHGLKIEIEVKNLGELKKAVEHKADIVMLDNFDLKQIQEALNFLDQKNRPFVEISGGISPENIEKYILPGIDILSSGSISHSVKSSDFSLLIE